MQLARRLPAIIAYLPGHRELLVGGIERVLHPDVIRPLAPEQRQHIFFTAGDDTGFRKYLERVAVQIGIIRSNDNKVAKGRGDFLIKRNQLIVAEGKQKASPSLAFRVVVSEQAVASHRRDFEEIPRLESGLDLGTWHPAFEFPHLPRIRRHGKQPTPEQAGEQFPIHA